MHQSCRMLFIQNPSQGPFPEKREIISFFRLGFFPGFSLTESFVISCLSWLKFYSSGKSLSISRFALAQGRKISTKGAFPESPSVTVQKRKNSLPYQISGTITCRVNAATNPWNAHKACQEAHIDWPWISIELWLDIQSRKSRCSPCLLGFNFQMQSNWQAAGKD